MEMSKYNSHELDFLDSKCSSPSPIVSVGEVGALCQGRLRTRTSYFLIIYHIIDLRRILICHMTKIFAM